MVRGNAEGDGVVVALGAVGVDLEPHATTNGNSKRTKYRMGPVFVGTAMEYGIASGSDPIATSARWGSLDSY